MPDSRLTERLAEIRGNVKAALGAFPALESSALRSGPTDLGPLEDSLRRAIREVGRLRLSTNDPRHEQEAWWECADCRAKLGAVSALTVTIVRKDLTVHVARTEGAVIVVGCPRCRKDQQFIR